MTDDRQQIDLALERAVDVVVTDQCCGTCSAYEAGQRLERIGGGTYAYHHEQDQEGSFVDGHLVDDLYVGFGSSQNATEITAGEQIVDQLRDLGFRPEWDGTAAHRIKVLAPGPSAWSRYRPDLGYRS